MPALALWIDALFDFTSVFVLVYPVVNIDDL
jgi:hypothetical protein